MLRQEVATIKFDSAQILVVAILIFVETILMIVLSQTLNVRVWKEPASLRMPLERYVSRYVPRGKFCEDVDNNVLSYVNSTTCPDMTFWSTANNATVLLLSEYLNHILSIYLSIAGLFVQAFSHCNAFLQLIANIWQVPNTPQYHFKMCQQ